MIFFSVGAGICSALAWRRGPFKFRVAKLFLIAIHLSKAGNYFGGECLKLTDRHTLSLFLPLCLSHPVSLSLTHTPHTSQTHRHAQHTGTHRETHTYTHAHTQTNTHTHTHIQPHTQKDHTERGTHTHTDGERHAHTHHLRFSVLVLLSLDQL